MENVISVNLVAVRKLTITWSISLLVSYLSERVSSTSSQCFDTDIAYYIYLLLKFTYLNPAIIIKMPHSGIYDLSLTQA